MAGNPKPHGQHIGNLRAENGGDFVNDTAEHTGQWFALVVEEDAVLTAVTQPYIENSDGRVGISYPQGFVIYGETTAFTLASGSVLAVKF